MFSKTSTLCIFYHWSIFYEMMFSKKPHFLPKKSIFLTKNAIYTPAPPYSALMSRNFFFLWYFSSQILKDILEEGGGHGENPVYFCPFFLKINIQINPILFVSFLLLYSSSKLINLPGLPGILYILYILYIYYIYNKYWYCTLFLTDVWEGLLPLTSVDLTVCHISTG